MQGAGDENAADATTMEFDKVFAAAHAAGGEDVFGRRLRSQLIQQIDIRPLIAAHPAERHDDQPLGPELRLLTQRLRAEELAVLEIEREDNSVTAKLRCERGDTRLIALRLAAEDQITEVLPQPALAVLGRRQSVVHPEAESGKTSPQIADDGAADAFAHDGIEIGDVDGGEGMNPEIPSDDVHRLA